jgi:hypothetical protein
MSTENTLKKDLSNELYTLLAKVNSFVKNDKKESGETIGKLPHNSSNVKYFQGRQDISNEIIKLLGDYFR